VSICVYDNRNPERGPVFQVGNDRKMKADHAPDIRVKILYYRYHIADSYDVLSSVLLLHIYHIENIFEV
jgi:hypothetical protein